MRIAEFGLSAIIAFAIAYVIYHNDRGSSVPLKSTSNDYTVEINSVPQALADTFFTIPVIITGERSEKVKFLFRYALPKFRDPGQLYRYGATSLTVVDSSAGLYEAAIRTGAKGTLSYYYFEIRDPVGRNIGGLKSGSGGPLTTMAVGRVDSWVKYGYYVCLFIATLSVSMGAFRSIRMISSKSAPETLNRMFLTASVFAALAVFIFGIMYRLQLIAGSWQGAPWGIGLSDNLRQILVLYLIFVTASTTTIKTKSAQIHTAFSTTAIGYLGISSFFVMITALLLPLFVRVDYQPISWIFYVFLTFFAFGIFLIFRRTRHA